MKSIILIAYENDCYNYVYLYHSLSSRGYDVHVIIGDFFSLITGNNYVQNIHSIILKLNAKPKG